MNALACSSKGSCLEKGLTDLESEDYCAWIGAWSCVSSRNAFYAAIACVRRYSAQISASNVGLQAV